MSDFRDEIYYSYIDSNNQPCINPLVYSTGKYIDIFTPSNLQIYRVLIGTSGNLEAISNSLYGTQDYWWLLAIINGIDDILTALPVGTFLYYPPQQLIQQYKSSLSEIMNNNNGNNNSTYIGGNTSIF